VVEVVAVDEEAEEEAHRLLHQVAPHRRAVHPAVPAAVAAAAVEAVSPQAVAVPPMVVPADAPTTAEGRVHLTAPEDLRPQAATPSVS
jgi:hypothetical protein